MSRDRLSGFVRPARRQGRVVRGLWELWVCLSPEPASGKGGLPLLDAKGRPKMRYPKTMKMVEAQGKKAAERLLEARIAELEQHQAIDVEKLTLTGLLDRWLEATYGEMRGATRNSTTLRHYVRLTTTARAKAVAGLDEVTRAALEAAQAHCVAQDETAPSNVVELASRRCQVP